MEYIPYLKDLLQFMEAHDEIIIWVSSISFIAFIGTLAAIPYILTKLPADYFIKDKNLAHRWYQDKPVPRIITITFKNVFGVIFLIMGFLMLFIPGQGLLTMLIGFSLLDFVNMRGPVYRVVSRPAIYEFINNIREKAGKQKIELRD